MYRLIRRGELNTLRAGVRGLRKCESVLLAHLRSQPRVPDAATTSPVLSGGR